MQIPGDGADGLGLARDPQVPDAERRPDTVPVVPDPQRAQGQWTVETHEASLVFDTRIFIRH